MAEEMRGALALQKELEKAKLKLRDVNENIKKITGRDPEETRGPDRRGMMGNDGRGRERIFNSARRNIGGQDGPPAQRRVMLGGPFARLGPRPVRREDSGDEEEDQKHTVQSSVVAASLETRTKSLEKQSKDREGMARNKRMFGMILGTLQRFKTEAKDTKDKDDQRRKLEKKLDDKAEKEKVRVQQETRNLLDEMRLEQSKIRRLEQKMELVQDHEMIELEMVKLANFLCTKSKPSLFYMPKRLQPSDHKKFKEAGVYVKHLIDEKKSNMEKEITEMMARESSREERIRSRIAERSRHVSGEVEEEEEEEEDHHDDHENDQQAIDTHKALMRENKENVVKQEPDSDVEMTDRPIKAERNSDDEQEDSEEEVMEVGEDGDRPVKVEDKEGGSELTGEKTKDDQDDEMEDGGMVNTVGGAGAKPDLDKEGHNTSKQRHKSDSTDRPTKSDKRGRHSSDRDRDQEKDKRTSSKHKTDSSRTDRDKRKSSDKREHDQVREHRRSRSRERKDRHKHSRHNKDEKRKRTRHDSDDEETDKSSKRDKEVKRSKAHSKDDRLQEPSKDKVRKMDEPLPSVSKNITEDPLFNAMVEDDLEKTVESREERERKIVMAEDGEDGVEEPADE